MDTEGKPDFRWLWPADCSGFSICSKKVGKIAHAGHVPELFWVHGGLLTDRFAEQRRLHVSGYQEKLAGQPDAGKWVVIHLSLHGKCKSEGYAWTILAPNGVRASLAILKNCLPKGMPIMVMHHNIPVTILPRAIQSPKKISQMILARVEGAPPP